LAAAAEGCLHLKAGDTIRNIVTRDRDRLSRLLDGLRP
jgi:hypothetical protein